MKKIRLWWRFVAAVAGAMAIALHTGAQPFPSKPLRIVVPAGPGSLTDVMARIVGARLAANVGRPVAVENVPDAGGLAGLSSVVKAPADGHTMLFGDITALMLNAANASSPLNLARDLTPVSLVAQVPVVLVVSPSLPVKSVRELIDFAKARPHQLASASVGSGGGGTFAGEQFKALTRTSIPNIPFRATGEVLTALVGNQVQMAFVPLAVARPLARDGKLRVLAITGDKRSTLDSGVPTFAEAGLPGFDVAQQFGVLLPPGAPRDVAARLNAEILKIVRTADTREQFARVGAEPTGTTPEQFAAYAHERAAMWAAMKRDGGSAGTAPKLPPPPDAGAPPSPVTNAPLRPPPVAAAPPPPVAAAPPPAAAPAPPRAPPVAAAPPPAAAAPQPPAAAVPPARVEAPAPSPHALTRKAQVQDAYWNSWFERGGARVARLEKDKEFTFTLDLSQYQYRIGQGAAVDPETLIRLKQAIDLNQKQLSFVIRPILVGGALEFADEPTALRRMTVELERLLVKDPAAVESQLLRRFRNGELPLSAFAKATRAGAVEFNVVAKRDGCASIAVSIWDESGRFPLDNLIHTVPVGAGPADGTSCSEDGSALRGGLATLLAPSLDRGPGASNSIDAALHVFEFPHSATKKRTVAILVDKSRYQAAKTGATVTERGVFAWELESSLSDYLVKPGQMLLKINDARDRANKGVDDAYASVADELRRKLFSGADDGQDRTAKLALAALQDMVRDAKHTPMIVVRMYSVDNEPVYLPLGLLAARAKDRVLARPVTIIQPLPRERYVSATACIDPWTFGIPQTLSPVGAVDMTGVVPRQTADPEAHWLRTLPDLATWLAQSESVPQKPEGFLLLAHHAEGNLWFDSEANRIVREQVSRKFSPGSVAVLSACSVANPAGDNRAILDKLNRNGMDAMIVSPFPVRTDYGIRLARNMISVIHDERSSGHTPTLVQIFKAAADRTVVDFAKYTAKLDEMSLEFLILGDYNMRMCKL